MNNHSIYSSAWINLVFEGRNTEYGAYRLRQENQRTTLKALFLALVLFGTLVSIPLLLKQTANLPAIHESPTLPEQKIVEMVMPPQPPTIKKKSTSTVPNSNSRLPQPNTTPVVVTSNVSPDVVEPDFSSGNTLTSGNAVSGPPTLSTGNSDGIESSIDNGSSVATPHDVSILDRLPSYPGGIDAFRKEIGRRFNVPSEQIEQAGGIVVLVSFVIETDGSISDILILRNPGHGLDKEAIRVLQSMRKKWQPGLIAGKPVRTLYKLPIRLVAH